MCRADTDDYLQLFLNDTPLLDLRAPVEFDKGAFANAINRPLMHDQERHLVGIRYQQQGPEAAIALGRELVTPQLQQQRTEQWLDFASQYPQGYLYCFRGGLRSRIARNWMAEGGFEYPCVKGGYKAMRRFLLDRFVADVATTPFILISGRTGTGKTLLLNTIQRSIDLEALANHRGSSFGARTRPQPTPINFENNIAVALLKLSHAAPEKTVFVEGEGRLVGKRALPEVLWQKMSSAPTIILETALETRIQIGLHDYVIALYASILAQHQQPGLAQVAAFDNYASRHRISLENIRKRLGAERYQVASKMLEAALAAHRENAQIDGYKPFIKLLLQQYYDPMYDYQLSKSNAKVLFSGNNIEVADWLASHGHSIAGATDKAIA